MNFPVSLIAATILCLFPGMAESSDSTNDTILEEINLRNTGLHESYFQQLVKGHISNELGKPISGVSVIVKDSKIGTTTDASGNFSLKASKGDVLIFSSIGYETRTIKIGDGDVTVQLAFFVSPLNQVVVSGNMVEIQRRADISSVSVLTAKDILFMPGQTIDRLLTGVVPGVAIPSVGTQESLSYLPLEIRGAGTPYGGYNNGEQAVKVYVDGVEFAAGSGYLALISKNDIERIEVVRGPSAATIYGSGANGGVILIFTKKGKQDKTSIDITTSAGFQNSKWVKKPFQQNHSLEISQGFKNFSYTVGGNYRTQQDYLPKGHFKMANSFANFNYMANKFDFALQTSYNSLKMDNHWNVVYDDVPDPYNYFILSKSPAYIKTNSSTNTRIVSFNINYKPKSWWIHSLVLGYTQNEAPGSTDGSVLTNKALVSFYTVNSNGLYYTDFKFNDFTKNARYVNTISINKPVNLFSMNILSGFEYSKYNSQLSGFYSFVKYKTTTGFTYSPTVLDSNNPLTYYVVKNTSGFVQLSPTIKNRYFLVAGLRYNSSNVSESALNSKIGFTTSFDKKGFVFKPRINFGTGITPPPYAATHPQISKSPFYSNLPNPGIKQQKQTGADLALEVYSKNDKFRAEIVRFDNVVTNGFIFKSVKRPTPGYPTHRDYIWINSGKFTNKGWEFSAAYKISSPLKLSVNYSIIRSVYVDTFDNYGTIYHNGDKVPNSPGYTAGLMLNYKFLKLFGRQDQLFATIGMISSGKMYAHDYYSYSVESSKIDPNGNDPYPDYDKYYYTTPAITKFNLDLSYLVNPMLTVFIQAENFLNNTTPDFDLSRPVAGASWMFGLRVNFLRYN